MKHVHWGIIGCGDVCERKSGPAFYKAHHSSLVAVMRRDRARAEDYAARHGVGRVYSTAEELVADPQVDIVYVATPPSTHREYTLLALGAGKPVYVEKPMAMDWAECLAMNEAAGRSGQKLFVAYYRRALPYFIKIRELLDRRAIGRVAMVEARFFRPAAAQDADPAVRPWRLDRSIGGEGYFYDMAPHTIDILDFLLGQIVEASGYCCNTASLYEVPDTVAASLRFRSGVSGTGAWSFACAPDAACDTVRITGTEGMIEFGIFSFAPIRLIDSSGQQAFAIAPPEHIQQPLIETIVAELRGEGLCPSTGSSGARTAWVIDRIVGNGLVLTHGKDNLT